MSEYNSATPRPIPCPHCGKRLSFRGEMFCRVCEPRTVAVPVEDVWELIDAAQENYSEHEYAHKYRPDRWQRLIDAINRTRKLLEGKERGE